MFGRPILWPSQLDYEIELLDDEGPFHVLGRYYGTADDAAVQRRRVAEEWVRRDARIRRQLEREGQMAPLIVC